MSPMKTLIYCLSILRIEKDSEIYRSAVELVQKVPILSVNGNNEWINATKIIATAYSSLTSYTFSQTQLSDFLTLSAKGIEEKRMNSEIIKNVLFKMYKDIIENYESFSQSLKSSYPRIVVDIIFIINQGIDTKGTKISPIGIENYYQLAKQQATGTGEGQEKTLATSTTTTTAATSIHKDKIQLSNNHLVRRLSQMTNRQIKELEESLAKLQDSDLKRISELCQNYRRLQHYSKLVTEEGSQEQFRKEIQRELGRELRSPQLRYAINSIRRAQTYIENILDNKFIPDASHGINHVKHNLEYGYQLINLIDRTRRRRQSTP